MIGIVATLKAKEGQGNELYAAAKELSAAVTANEPGCLLHQPFQLANDPDTIVFMERYADQASFEAHGKTEHMKVKGGAMGPFMAGRPDIQILNAS